MVLIPRLHLSVYNDKNKIVPSTYKIVSVYRDFDYYSLSAIVKPNVDTLLPRIVLSYRVPSRKTNFRLFKLSDKTFPVIWSDKARELTFNWSVYRMSSCNIGDMDDSHSFQYYQYIFSLYQQLINDCERFLSNERPE